jgi:hypothetical protein
MSRKPRYGSADEVIAAAEAQMKRTLALEEWEFFERRYYIEEVIKGDRSLDELIVDVKDHLKTFSSGVRRARGKSLPAQREVLDYRVLLVSHELAKAASVQPYVRRFRERHLPAGSVLPREIVGSWVRRHWPGPLSSWTVLVVDLDFQTVMGLEEKERATIDADGIRRALEAEEAGATDAIARITEHDKVAVNPIRLLEWPYTDPQLDDLEDGSALRDLMQAGEFLCSSYGWRKHQAIWFLLTGETPLLPMLLFDIRFPQTSHDRLRIILDIDIETSPDAVMSLYSDVRNRLWRGERRPLKRKMLALALFVDSTPESNGPERMRLWNAHCNQYGRAKWVYKEATNMSRDYNLRTIKRLKPQYDFDSLERLAETSWSFDPEQ